MVKPLQFHLKIEAAKAENQITLAADAAEYSEIL